MKHFRIIDALLLASWIMALTCCSKKDEIGKPVVTTGSVSTITPTSASVIGIITSNGGATITDAGICYATTQNPTTKNDFTQEKVTSGSFISVLSNLQPSTRYYVRAYAINSVGTTYGSTVNLLTLNIPAILITETPTKITTTTAQTGGTIISVGSNPIIAKGVCYADWSQQPTINSLTTNEGAGEGSFITMLTGLDPTTTYKIRAYVTTQLGTSYGEVLTFSTYGTPKVTGGSVSDVTDITATVSGTVSSDGGATVTDRGICWSTSPNPTISNNKAAGSAGTGLISVGISGLASGNEYYARIYAVNEWGPSYGTQISFVTGMRDFDNNLYACVKIGSQIWTKENLKVIHYRNGDAIPNVTDNAAWAALESTGLDAYCWYNNDINNKDIYGALYNWYTVNNNRGIAPLGWHVASDADVDVLSSYLGGDISIFGNNISAGGKLKETGTAHWNSDNLGATNETGFTALGSGYRHDYYGTFDCLKIGGDWWTSTSNEDLYARYYEVDCGDIMLDRAAYFKGTGMSIRLVKD